MEFFVVQRLARLEDHAGDPVVVLVARGGRRRDAPARHRIHHPNPTRAPQGGLGVKARPVQQHRRGDLALFGAHELGARVQAPENLLHVGELGRGDGVALVQDQHIRALGLFDQQFVDRFLRGRRGDHGRRRRPPLFREKIPGVNHGHQRREPRKIGRAAAEHIAPGKDPRHRARLGHARRLHEDLVVGAGGAQLDDRLGEVVAHRAADAAVAQLHHPLRPGLSHQLRIDVDRRQVIDHRRPAPAAGLRQQVAQQGRLARAQKAAEDRHGRRLGGRWH